MAIAPLTFGTIRSTIPSPSFFTIEQDELPLSLTKTDAWNQIPPRIDLCVNSEPKFPKYPRSRRLPTTDNIFGISVTDPYRWLEDGMSSHAVKMWVKHQTRYSRAQMADLHSLRLELQNRLSKPAPSDVPSAVITPARHGDTLFWSSLADVNDGDFFSSLFSKNLHCRGINEEQDRLLLDFKALNTETESYRGLGNAISPDGKYVTYETKSKIDQTTSIHVKKTSVGGGERETLKTAGSFACITWHPDGKGFFYTYTEEDAPPSQDASAKKIPVRKEVRYHEVDTPQSQDYSLLALEGKYAEVGITILLANDGEGLFFILHLKNSREKISCHLDITKPSAKILVIHQGEENLKLAPHGEQIYILKLKPNNQNAPIPEQAIYQASKTNPAESNWETVVPARKHVLIDDMLLAKDHLVLTVLEQASHQIEIRDLNGALVHRVALPGPGTVRNMKIRTEGASSVEFEFSSPTISRKKFKFSIPDGVLTAIEDASDAAFEREFITERILARSRDGTEIPLFLTRRKDAPRDGNLPIIMHAYGGFGMRHATPAFNPFSAELWLKSGGAYATVAIRGGGELGPSWHQDGVKTKRQNSFDDFIAGARTLISLGYTNPQKLAAWGESNGGLLMSAIVTQTPHLFRAIASSVPLTDMVRYTQPATPDNAAYWMTEYGNPGLPEEFSALYAYSPYHRVVAGTSYPSVLFQSALSDPVVDPMHARKMTAALQQAQIGTAPILFSTTQNAGHDWKNNKPMEAAVERYAFFMRELGIAETQSRP